MKKIFYDFKEKVSCFLWESEKPFFSVVFAVIISLFVFSFVSMFIAYDISGTFFKENDYGNYSQMLEQKKIEIIFNDEGNEMYIVKKGPIDLNFQEVSFVDKYYSLEYQIVFPEDYSEYFEKEFFKINGNFVDSVYVEKTVEGKTVLNIHEKDIFGFEVSERKNFIRVSIGSPDDIYDKIVVIDPGHGGADFGVNNGNVMEKDITLDICKRVQDLFLGSEEIKVYLTRNFDDYLKDEKRVFFANECADLFLSVHLNSVDNYNYSEDSKIIISDTNRKDNYDLSENYSKALKDSILKYINIDDIEISGETKFILENAEMPAVFLKLGYKGDFVYSDFLNNTANGIYDSVNEFFEWKMCGLSVALWFL